jgi:death-on-curing protein
VTETIEFLTLEDVLEIHAAQLARWGGSEGIRDRGALEAAIAQPQAAFGGDYLHEDVFAMAAAYAFHIAESQSFVDGNKRAGLDAALTFLRLNEIRVPDPEGALFEAMIAIGTRRMTKDELGWLLRDLADV